MHRVLRDFIDSVNKSSVTELHSFIRVGILLLPQQNFPYLYSRNSKLILYLVIKTTVKSFRQNFTTVLIAK